MRWRANIDFTPPITEYALVDYIAKYCTKIKKKSILYSELVREILSRINSRVLLLSLTLKLMNKFLIERDWSA